MKMIASNLKFLNNLQPDWSRLLLLFIKRSDLHSMNTLSCRLLEVHQKEVDDQDAERLAKKHMIQLALMANSNNPFNFQWFHHKINHHQIAQIGYEYGVKGQQMRWLELMVGIMFSQMQIALKEEAGIQLTQEEFDFMADAGAYEEIERVNANCTLKDNLQQASTSGTQTDKAPVYDSDESAEVHHSENCYDNDIFNMFTQEEQYTKLLEPIPESHQVPQNDSNVISEVSSVEQSGGTVEQHPATPEETRALYDSLYNNLATEVEKVNSVNRKLRETNADLTTELARYKNQEKCFEISQEKYDKLERCYQKSVYQEQCLTKKINTLHLSSGK
ncbi:hypothetical protein Tco_1056812 [Tanacetum coccineum]|uniref:Uncharacterized protein n=1 Tax=Tanacetum coccineum TaxID=301880 RepID=A0ABQ5H521_9ASTR